MTITSPDGYEYELWSDDVTLEQIEDFDAGEDCWHSDDACIECNDDCDSCALCCNFGDYHDKCAAFADYLESQGIEVRREGFERKLSYNLRRPERKVKMLCDD